MNKVLMIAFFLSFGLSLHAKSEKNCKVNSEQTLLLRDQGEIIEFQGNQTRAIRLPLSLSIVGYAYSTFEQTIEANGFVSFNFALSGDCSCITPPNVAGYDNEDYCPYQYLNNASSFLIYCSGWYLFQYQVRGRPYFAREVDKKNQQPQGKDVALSKEHHHDSTPLVFELWTQFGEQAAVIPGSRYASDNVVHHLDTDGTEVVNGFVIAYIDVPLDFPVTVQLRNVTNDGKTKVHLHNTVRKENDVVNASLNVVQLAPAIIV